MKRMSREFTNKEKALLIILGILMVLVVYYYMVDIPLRSQKETLMSQRDQLNEEYNQVHMKYTEYLGMQADMEKVTEETSIMESYNNRSKEIAFLDQLFAKTLQYSVGFSPVTVQGDQIRRSFSVTFTAKSYKQAIKILGKLADCHYRCVINDISCSGTGEKALDGPVTVSCGATFFETMVERTTDAGLPAPEPEPVVEEEVSGT